MISYEYFTGIHIAGFQVIHELPKQGNILNSVLECFVCNPLSTF